jgi:hypothetical protein
MRNRRDPRTAAAVFPDPLHMRHEPGNEHDVRRTTADGLEREVDTIHFDIARSRRFQSRGLAWLLQQGNGSRVKGHAKLFLQVPGACFELALGCRPVPGRQEGADQIAVRAFAQRIQSHQTRRMHNRGARLSSGDLPFDQALQRLCQAAAQGLAPEERPFLEFLTIRQGEARKKIARVSVSCRFKRAVVAGVLKDSGVNLDGKRRVQAEGGSARSDEFAAKGDSDLVKDTPKARPSRLFVGFGPQQRGRSFTRDGPTGLGKKDEERGCLAQGKWHPLSVHAELRKAQEPKLQSLHRSSRGKCSGRGR